MKYAVAALMLLTTLSTHATSKSCTIVVRGWENFSTTFPEKTDLGKSPSSTPSGHPGVYFGNYSKAGIKIKKYFIPRPSNTLIDIPLLGFGDELIAMAQHSWPSIWSPPGEDKLFRKGYARLWRKDFNRIYGIQTNLWTQKDFELPMHARVKLRGFTVDDDNTEDFEENLTRSVRQLDECIPNRRDDRRANPRASCNAIPGKWRGRKENWKRFFYAKQVYGRSNGQEKLIPQLATPFFSSKDYAWVMKVSRFKACRYDSDMSIGQRRGDLTLTIELIRDLHRPLNALNTTCKVHARWKKPANDPKLVFANIQAVSCEYTDEWPSRESSRVVRRKWGEFVKGFRPF